MKIKARILAAVAALSLASTAHATVVQSVSETFESGAVFSGEVSFADDFSSVTGVSGLLSGGSYGSVNINWVWIPGFNFNPTGGSTFGTFLMDGTPDGSGICCFSNFVTFSYDYSNPAKLVFDTTYQNGILDAAGGNNVNYDDPLVSGTISALPEISTWMMMLAGLGVVGFAMRKRPRNSRQGVNLSFA
jgi:hypothetical protein